MSEHRTLASVAWQQQSTVTRRERFLAERKPVIPWRRLLAVIAPHDPRAGRGRQPLGLEKRRGGAGLAVRITLGQRSPGRHR